MDFSTSLSINVQINEEVEPLWRNFHQKTNEMIISKGGRKIFPNIEFKVSGLPPEMVYVFLLKFTSDKRRYRYSCQEWTNSQDEKFKDCSDVILHTDGAQKGQKWVDHPVLFEFVRLTNESRNKKENMVFLQSQHKYRPVLEIYSIPGVSNGNLKLEEFKKMQGKMLVYNSGFELMDFIAVTAYQNREVNDFKKETNKYASAFKAKEMKEKEKKEAERRSFGAANQMQGIANPFLHGQNPYQHLFNYPPYFWNNPAAMMNQFGPFGQMQNQFAPGPNTSPAVGNMPNIFGAMPGFSGAMPNMSLLNGMPAPASSWPQNPTFQASQASVAQAPPTFAAQAYQMPPQTQFMVPPTTPVVQQAPPLTPTSSNQSTSSTGASPVEPTSQNQMIWPNYNQNMMNYGMVPQGRAPLDLQKPFNNLANFNNSPANNINNINNNNINNNNNLL